MACKNCSGTRFYKGLPCIACQISANQRATIRNKIYYGAPWRAKLVSAKLGNVRPMIDLVVDSGMDVMNYGGPTQKAVLRRDLQLVMKTLMVHYKAGTTPDRVRAELDEIVEKAAREHSLTATVVKTSGSGVLEGVGTATPTVDSVQEDRRNYHVRKAGLDNNIELQSALLKLQPDVFVCVYADHVVSGDRKFGREAMQNLAPNTVTGALPGQTTRVPWLLYRVEIPDDMPKGNEFCFAAEILHYPSSKFGDKPPSLMADSLAKTYRNVADKPLPVGKHGPCADCQKIAQDQNLYGFELAFASASVVPGETHGHACDRVMGELMQKFREIEHAAN